MAPFGHRHARDATCCSPTWDRIRRSPCLTNAMSAGTLSTQPQPSTTSPLTASQSARSIGAAIAGRPPTRELYGRYDFHRSVPQRTASSGLFGPEMLDPVHLLRPPPIVIFVIYS